MINYKTLMTIALLALAPACAKADVIYSQTFSDVTSPSGLNGTAVEVGTGDWIAGDVFQTDGSMLEAGRRTSALLPFAITEGEVYELSVTLDVVGAGNHFLGLGFADNNGFTGGTQNDGNNFRLAGTVANNAPVIGYAWMFLSGSGGMNAFDGDGINNALGLTDTASTTGTTLKVLFDTTDAVNWTTEYYANGTLVGSSSQAKALYANIDSVGLTVGNASGAFSDFQLQTLNAVPEPGSAAVVGLLAVGMMFRRRR